MTITSDHGDHLDHVRPHPGGDRRRRDRPATGDRRTRRRSRRQPSDLQEPSRRARRPRSRCGACGSTCSVGPPRRACPASASSLATRRLLGADHAGRVTPTPVGISDPQVAVIVSTQPIQTEPHDVAGNPEDDRDRGDDWFGRAPSERRSASTVPPRTRSRCPPRHRRSSVEEVPALDDLPLVISTPISILRRNAPATWAQVKRRRSWSARPRSGRICRSSSSVLLAQDSRDLGRHLVVAQISTPSLREIATRSTGSAIRVGPSVIQTRSSSSHASRPGPSPIHRSRSASEIRSFGTFAESALPMGSQGTGRGSSPPAIYARTMESAAQGRHVRETARVAEPATGELVGSVPTITPGRRSRASSTTSPGSSPPGPSSRSRTAAATCAAPPTRCSTTSTRSPSCSSASRASRAPSPTRWSCCRRSTPCTGAPKAGPKILADEKIPMRQAFLTTQEQPLHLRADRRRRRDRALELPLVDPLRRGRDRADGRQRRRAQAGQPDAAARRGDPRASSRSGGAARGPGPRRPRRRRGRRRAANSSVGKIFFTGSVEVGRKVGEVCAEAAEGLGARARRQGPDDRLRRRRPRQRDLRRRLGRLRQRRPDLLGDRARLRHARGRRPLHRRRRPRGASSCGRRPARVGRPRSAR